ncbi:MAG: metallophosphoesterase [Cyclobacteriaceae bacterium]|nr:metallophosphoesterase [Cyclobacteriaceae bacterium]MDH4295388.1 metallophosphoesterase [Cyclobacteriaceae bacterium]MDH5249624.1 metallophosphoesterase [Cyclobacteriaceae bacterium]
MKKLLLLLLSVTCTAGAQQLLVPPYLQPGNSPALTKEQKVLIWQTDSVPGSFKVEYGQGSNFEDIQKVSTAKISSVQLRIDNKTTVLYRAQLSRVTFDNEYVYRVTLNGNPVATKSFNSRTKKPQTRFVVFGDCGAGTPQQAKIAYQVYNQKPQFVLITGDNVYSDGLGREYLRNFFPYYLAPEADSLKGAPLMSSVPFYTMLGNHDVHGTDLDKTPDGLAYFYYADLPLNAPVTELTIKATGSPERVKDFNKNTDNRFPEIANYSFDYGNVHIACLDANMYTNPLDPTLMAWLQNDMKTSRADWKIVAFHHPGFNTANTHYDDQLMRLCSPQFESMGVDLVFSGHVHNYQRSKPLIFSPKKNEDHTLYIITPEGRVDGEFELDEQFDGKTNTKPKGIIYIVTGAGGATLYDPGLSGNPDLWKHDLPGNWVPFTAKLIADVHSFTLIETEQKKLTLKQVNESGKVLDEITVTK